MLVEMNSDKSANQALTPPLLAQQLPLALYLPHRLAQLWLEDLLEVLYLALLLLRLAEETLVKLVMLQ